MNAMKGDLTDGEPEPGYSAAAGEEIPIGRRNHGKASMIDGSDEFQGVDSDQHTSATGTRKRESVSSAI